MLQSAGIENFIMNVYRHIDRTKIQFDFLVTRNQEEFFDDEIAFLGGKKHTIDCMNTKNVLFRVLKESFQIFKFLKKSPEYKIMHVHSGTPLRVFYLLAGKMAKCPVRIYHSHSAEVKGPHSNLGLKKYVFKILLQLFPYWGTDFFACSKLAAEWMYSQRMINAELVKVINNGIDLNVFSFNHEIRQEFRSKMNINDNQFVIGHIGRFDDQKNHTFLINIFQVVVNKNPNAILWLIGTGELKEKIREKVQRLKLEKHVVFLGVRSDVMNLMQAMDVFLLPSNYEGLPVVAVEAQAVGLPCVMSDTITEEAKIIPNSFFISLNASLDFWSDKVCQFACVEKQIFEKRKTSEYLSRCGFDIRDVARDIEQFYCSC